MRIAHLSDLHFCSKYKAHNIFKTDRLIKLAVDKGAEHLVITGDISDNANKNDYNVLRKILKKYNLLSSEKTSIVIGNHDIFGRPQTAKDVLNFPSKCLATSYNEKVAQFVNHFSELFENTYRVHRELYFPFIKELKDVVLIGMNSIAQYSRLKNPFASNGRISKIQRRSLKHLLKRKLYSEKIKIALVHHHFYHINEVVKSSERTVWNKIENYTMKLRGKGKLLNLFNELDISVVLHGHSHENREYLRKGIKFINAGGSVDNGSEDFGEILLFDSNAKQIVVETINLSSDTNILQSESLLEFAAA